MLKALLMLAVAATCGGKIEDKKEQPKQEPKDGAIYIGNEWDAFKAWAKNNGGFRP